MAPKGAVAEGPYEDFEAFLTHADELASSLLEQGITGMKIWPFDDYAAASKGCYISGPDLDRALEPFRKIRKAVGNRMDIMVELHTLWNLPTAKRIMAALEEFDPFWFEDPIRMNNADALAELASLPPRDHRQRDPGHARFSIAFISRRRDRHRDARPQLDRAAFRGPRGREPGGGQHLPIAPMTAPGRSSMPPPCIWR
jgi:hypothetical protein